MTPAEVAALSRAISAKANRDQQQTVLLPATVLQFMPAVGRGLPTARVTINGDDDAFTIDSTVVSGEVTAGQQAMVLFVGDQSITFGGTIAVPTGGWTITAGDNFETYNSTTQYTMDQDDSMSTIVVDGISTDMTSVTLEILVNSISVATITLPTNETFTTTDTVDLTLLTGDTVELSLTVVYGGEGSLNHIFSAVMNLAGTHANETITWNPPE